jgi:hypothetical protein
MERHVRIRPGALLAAFLLTLPASGGAQSSRPAAGVNEQTGSPGSAGPGPGVVQRGSQPNAGEVRPGSPDGDAPSAAAGRLVRDPDVRRVLGLPVSTALIIGGVLMALLVLAWIVIPRARPENRARGGGTYGGPR